jgi:hypothetical protein
MAGHPVERGALSSHRAHLMQIPTLCCPSLWSHQHLAPPSGMGSPPLWPA